MAIASFLLAAVLSECVSNPYGEGLMYGIVAWGIAYFRSVVPSGRQSFGLDITQNGEGVHLVPRNYLTNQTIQRPV